VLTYVWSNIQKRTFAKEIKTIAFEGNKYDDPWDTSAKPTYRGKTPFPTSTFLPYLPSLPISNFAPLENEKRLRIDSDAIGKVVILDKAEIGKFFPEGLLGEFKKKDSDLVHKGQRVGFLIRQEAVTTINSMHNHFWTQSNHRTLLHGVDGSGKSGVLSSIIYWARSHGYLVLVVRNGRDITHGSMIEQSVREPELYDTVEPAYNIITGFNQCHKNQLSQIKLKTQFTLPGFKRHDQSTVGDLVQFGVKHKQMSCDVLFYLKGELELTTEFPVLVAVDDISSFFCTKKWVL